MNPHSTIVNVMRDLAELGMLVRVVTTSVLQTVIRSHIGSATTILTTAHVTKVIVR